MAAIVHSIGLPASVEVTHAAFCGEQYWRDRLAAVGGPQADLVSLRADGDTVIIEMTQGIAAEKLPSFVAAVRRGDLLISRTETWGPLQDGRAHGSFSAKVEGAPATLGGDLYLEPDGEHCTFRVDGAVDVRVPLIGNKIASAAAGQLQRLLEKEDEFTREWLAAHR
ncbi:DUF2505 domain-containing protein [Skermania sp. ID1734]|uniref:DUF2505 domain-containing protein n=1 Tax=Skermania sp. ID1734 TaxID=2597516 RepID=UPI001181090A|nr:DUF2505 domain-containing protein [Skermania sp. ID1734]TSD99532.1 DUF2505 domain-containing protein [Skermania sp. ID1734]